MPIQKKYICNLCNSNAEDNSGGELSDVRLISWDEDGDMVMSGVESPTTSNVVLCGHCIKTLREFFAF